MKDHLPGVLFVVFGAILSAAPAMIFPQGDADAEATGGIMLVVDGVKAASRPLTGDRSVVVGFTVTGASTPSVLRRVDITRAADDKGGSVEAGSKLAPPRSPEFRIPTGGALPATGNLTFEVRGREAKSISVVEGTIELLEPTVGNGGAIVIPNIKAQAGRFIDHPALNKHGVEFAITTPEAYRSLLTRGGPLAPDMIVGVVAIMRSQQDTRVVGYELHDATGKLLASGHGNYGGGAASTASRVPLAGALPEEARLTIYLGIPEAVRVIPLWIENIRIP